MTTTDAVSDLANQASHRTPVAACDWCPEPPTSSPRPLIVCLCGSTRFRAEFVEANRHLTMKGRIVVAPAVFAHDGDSLTDAEKEHLDDLHLRKIDLADAVYVVNPGGYVGDSTRREIEYAMRTRKPIGYLVEPGSLRPAQA